MTAAYFIAETFLINLHLVLLEKSSREPVAVPAAAHALAHVFSLPPRLVPERDHTPAGPARPNKDSRCPST